MPWLRRRIDCNLAGVLVYVEDERDQDTGEGSRSESPLQAYRTAADRRTGVESACGGEDRSAKAYRGLHLFRDPERSGSPLNQRQCGGTRGTLGDMPLDTRGFVRRDLAVRIGGEQRPYPLAWAFIRSLQESQVHR